MMVGIKQLVLIVIVSTLLALVVNMASSNRIPLVGNWPSIPGSHTVAVPPSADEGDPTFISLDEAAARFQSSGTLFIDTRDPEDYEFGRIKGSVNIPYDYLEDYLDTLRAIPRDKEIVTYCSGTECELSLFLGRDMQYEGFENIYIFYGGWREWKRAELPTDSGAVK